MDRDHHTCRWCLWCCVVDCMVLVWVVSCQWCHLLIWWSRRWWCWRPWPQQQSDDEYYVIMNRAQRHINVSPMPFTLSSMHLCWWVLQPVAFWVMVTSALHTTHRRWGYQLWYCKALCKNMQWFGLSRVCSCLSCIESSLIWLWWVVWLVESSGGMLLIHANLQADTNHGHWSHESSNLHNIVAVDSMEWPCIWATLSSAILVEPAIRVVAGGWWLMLGNCYVN